MNFVVEGHRGGVGLCNVGFQPRSCWLLFGMSYAKHHNKPIRELQLEIIDLNVETLNPKPLTLNQTGAVLRCLQNLSGSATVIPCLGLLCFVWCSA